MLDQDKLRAYCNESGVCQELRIAQDKLLALPIAAESKEKELISDFANQLEAYEFGFIQALTEYFENAESIDLIATSGSQDADPEEVLNTLNRCLAGLTLYKDKIDSVLSLIREQSIQSWL